MNFRSLGYFTRNLIIMLPRKFINLNIHWTFESKNCNILRPRTICFLDPNYGLKFLIPNDDNNLHSYTFHVNAPKYINL